MARHLSHVLLALSAWLLVTAEPALACAVCYGASDDPIVHGAELSVLFLGVLTYLLIGGGALAVVLHRRKLARRSPAEETP